MKLNLIIHMAAITITMLVVGISSAAWASEPVLTPPESRLLERINHARTNPLAAAAEIGLDPDEVLANFPELTEILINGLPVLMLQGQLTDAARNHTRDMLENNYYDHVSPEGETLMDRLNQVGYLGGDAGETLGMVAFLSFIDDIRAADAVFENMYRDELDPERVENRNILDANITETGVSMESGRLELDAGAFNAYVVTCTFGNDHASMDTLNRMGNDLIHLINQARANPAETLARYGAVDQDGLPDLELLAQLPAALPPVIRNAQLTAAAEAHTGDMIDRYYFSSITPDGATPEDRMRWHGYGPVVVSGEILEWAPAAKNDPSSVVTELFRRIIRIALAPENIALSPVWNPEIREIGVGLEVAAQQTDAGNDWLFIATLDFGARESWEGPFVTGITYRDIDGDGRFSPGEGVSDQAVIVYGAGIHLETDAAGGFSTPLSAGNYWLIHFGDTGELNIRPIQTETDSLWAAFEIE